MILLLRLNLRCDLALLTDASNAYEVVSILPAFPPIFQYTMFFAAISVRAAHKRS